MDYQLAKQLADSGFPYKWEKTDENNEPFEAPTLSELIEACGDNFVKLEKVPSGWGAFGRMEKYTDLTSDTMQCGGLTPDVAVARLYLALNARPS